MNVTWFRTADILPPPDIPVLIVRRKNLEEPLRVEQGTLLPDGRWKSFGHFFQQKNVLFWMPMPEPPEDTV